MNIVDKFIIEENFEGMVLKNPDFSEIGLGIILGNLGKVQFSPEFCKNLCVDTKINPAIKVVFLQNILQKLFFQIQGFSGNNKFIAQGLVEQFNDVSNLLSEVFDFLGDFKSLVTSTYTELLGALLRKFSFCETLASIPLNAYKLKGLLNLKSSFFLLSPDELQLFLEQNYQSSQEMLNLLAISCNIVSMEGLKPSDELCIITFNSFYSFLNYLIENHPTFDYKKVFEVLIRSSNNFTYRQRARFREVYNRLRDLKRVSSDIEEFIKVFSMEPDYTARKVGQDSYVQKNRYPQAAPYPVNRHDEYSQAKRYNAHCVERSEREVSEEIDRSVKTGLGCLIETLKFYVKDQEIDEEILECNIRDLMNISLSSLHYHLSHYSYYEQDFSKSSLFAWNSILRAVKRIETYPVVELKELEYYIEYLNSSG